MHNLELELALEKLRGEMRELDAQLAVLQKEQRRDETAGTTIQQMREQRLALEEVIRERTVELDDLHVKAPVDGVVLPVVDKADREPPDGQLPGWVGSPLSTRNRGAFLAANDRICQIGDPSELVAEIVIDQADVELVWAAFHERKAQQLTGVPVTLMLDSLPGQSFESQIETVTLAKLEETPLGLSTMAGGDVDSVMDQETGVPRPLSTSYPAIATLPEVDRELQLGMRGKAKIYVQWQSLGARTYRFVKRTFHFEM
jgi:multidrug efflux pump subunit AcrA (membrane-fusion protein)